MKNLVDLIPDPSSLEIGEPDLDHLGDLSKISLVSLTATPHVIGPFGSSVIAWEVQDDNSGCDLRLNGVKVPITGSMRVTPNVNFPYQLKATNGLHTKDLGEVEVRVETRSCRMDDFGYVNQAFKTLLSVYAPGILGLQLRDGLNDSVTVRTGPGLLHFTMRLKSNLDNLPDPQVDIEGDLGLIVVDDGPLLNRKKIHGYFQNLTVNAHYAWHQWLRASALGPQVGLTAAMAINSARDAARNNIARLFDQVINTSLISGIPPMEMGIQNVILSAGPDGLGQVRRVFCPLIGGVSSSTGTSTARRKKS